MMSIINLCESYVISISIYHCKSCEKLICTLLLLPLLYIFSCFNQMIFIFSLNLSSLPVTQVDCDWSTTSTCEIGVSMCFKLLLLLDLLERVIIIPHKMSQFLPQIFYMTEYNRLYVIFTYRPIIFFPSFTIYHADNCVSRIFVLEWAQFQLIYWCRNIQNAFVAFKF